MRLRPKYTREKEEGRHIQRSGSLISTFLMRCRLRRLVLAAGDDLFHQFHVLNTLLGSIHGVIALELLVVSCICEHPCIMLIFQLKLKWG